MASPSRATEPPRFPDEAPTGPVVGPPEQWPALPPAPPDELRDRAWAAVCVAWSGTIVATVAAFAPWAHYVDGVAKTGVEHGDGWFVLAVALVAAGLTGALAFGWRHRAVRLGLLGTAVGLLVLYAVNRVDVARSHDRLTGGPIHVGGGLFAVAVGACLILVGALLIPSTARATGP